VIKWVVFDLGDVVLRRTTALPGLSSLMVAELQGFTKAYYQHRRDYDRHSDANAFWGSVASSTGSSPPDQALIEELVRVDDIGWNDVDPDTQKLIDDIARTGTALAVLSNAPSTMGRLVEAQPWAGTFRQLFFSGDLGVVKPDPAIYQHLLQAVRAAPEEVVFLDDRPENVAGAIASGIHGFVFTDAAQ